MSEWVKVGWLRVEAGLAVVTTPEYAAYVPADAALDDLGPVGVGVDLGPILGISGVVIPTGMGDGSYPIEVRTVLVSGAEKVAEVRIRFIDGG